MVRRALMLLANEYRPDPRVEKEAEALAQSGVEMMVLAWDRARSREEREERQGVAVQRVRTISFRSKRGVMLNYPLYLLRSIGKGIRMDVDLVHAHDLDTLFAGVMISQLKGIPLIYDAHEHYARMVSGDLPPLICRWMDRWESFLVRRADRVIAANTKIAEYLQDGLDRKVIVVMNCIDPPELRLRDDDRKGLTVFYGGALEPLRYILEIAQAVEGTDNAILRVAGTGTLEPELKRMAEGDGKVRFLGYLPRERIMEEIMAADLVIALLDPSNENNRIGTPNRLFEAMAAGTPVLVSSGTLSGSIVEQEDSGYSIEWSETEFRRVIAQLAKPGERERLGENGRRAVQQRYNWTLMKERLIELYSSL